ncbi:hypothetical protein F0562_020171 [Nyssa sinensis]|uniref:Uncharacterized protein n=1 Tax=Nyssa sinensis TaxID=561372 RepID=A0A5J5BUE5_9ASTE|nr:hypothetical protein F0562_020171 [Nyssa sinensis]
MSEMRGGGGGFDRSNLHLKKELTQIRKAARVLRDPGTSSSWRSPLSSARSAALNAASSSTNHYYHQYKISNGEAIGGGDNAKKVFENKIFEHHSEYPLRVESNGNNGREKKVFLYNWRTKSSSEKSNQRRQGDDDDGIDGSSSVPEESVDDSLSDARNGGGDSKSDSYTADRRSSKQARDGLPSVALGLGLDDSVSLVDQSDDTEEYYNSEDLRRISAASPLLSRLKQNNWSHSSSKLLRNGRKEDSSYSYSTPALSTSSYNRYGNRNPSTIGSWDGTTASFNDGDDEDR